MKASVKRLLSMVIVLAMVLSVLPVIALAVDTTTVYCQAPDNWFSCKIYWWGSAGTNPSWPGIDMTLDEQGLWTYNVPADATGLIFNNGTGTQTSDLLVPTDENTMYVFQNNYWTLPIPVPTISEYYVAGEAALCGVDWDPCDPNNKMSDENSDGIYTITYENVAAGTYQFKVTDGTWNESWGDPNSDYGVNNYQLTVPTDNSTVEIQFDTATKLITVVINGESPTPSDREYYVAGSFNDWNPCDEAYKMIDQEDGTYALSFVLPAGDYELRVTTGSWDIFWGGNNEYGNFDFTVTRECTVTVIFDGSSISAMGEYLVVPDPGQLNIQSVHVAGSSGLTGVEWNPAYNQMTNDNGVYTITFVDVEAGIHEFKFTANGTWDINWGSGVEMDSGVVYDAWFHAMGNCSVTVPEDGYDVTVILDLNGMDPYTGEGASCSVLVEAPSPFDPRQIVDAAYALSDGESLNLVATLSGKIISIDTPYSPQYQNITVTIAVEGREDKPIMCFRLKGEGAEYLSLGDYITVSGTLYNYKGTIEFKQGCTLISGGGLPVDVFGTVTSGSEGETVIQLVHGDLVSTTVVSGKTGTYSISCMPNNKYTLRVSKQNHVTREYTVTVLGGSLFLDADLHLIGDVDGNGKVNIGDVAMIDAHLRGIRSLTDEYELLCANVNGGTLNMGDVAGLYAHIREITLLY